MAQPGTITVTDDDIQQAPPEKASTMPPPPSPTWWDRVNKGLVSPDQFLKWVGGGKTTIADLERSRDAPPKLNEKPQEAFNRVFHGGFMSDATKTASSLTSPVSIATSVLSQTAKLPGAVGKIARSMLAAQGLGYGASGGMEAIEGIKEGVKTPGGAQKLLSGASQVAGAAPAAAEVGRMGLGAMAKIAPELFAKGEGAFVAAIAPAKRDVPKLRMAYQRRASDLKAAPVKDLADLHTYAETKRVEAANELNRELGRINPQGTKIDPVFTADNIRGRVTKTLELSSPAEAKAVRDYAHRVEQEFLKHPVGLGEAESLVQELNARSAAFDKLPPEAQRQQLSEGSPILGEKALKEALQDQIEAKMTNYRDLKQRYGDWKEIQNQTQSRIDDIERKGTSVSFVQRRALESLMSAGGLVLGSQHGGGLAGGGIGSIGGYLAGRFFADQLLSRLSTPEHALSRGIRPGAPQSPLPFAGQITQPVASQIGKENQP
jgi:hypothetical protein